jgi:hypothetical protein
MRETSAVSRVHERVALVREKTSGCGLPARGLRISGSERKPAYRALSSG